MTLEQYTDIISYLRKIVSDSEYNGKLYSVGGCCRDKLMGNEIKDIDLVITLPDGGIRFTEWLYNNGYLTHKPVLYPTYGTSMFKLKEYPDIELEAVQTRKEQYHDENSRNPETCYGSLMEDCVRRDLTINSLYYDISNDKILDLTGNGIKDIEEHRIRVTSTPDIVYSDDPLRILRCIRFSSRFGWGIEENTYQGMKDNVGRLKIITKERIQDELNKMLLCKNPVQAIELLKDTGAMKYVIPELVETYEMCQNHYHFGTVFEHTLKTLDNVVNDCFFTGYFNENQRLVLRMSALLHDIGKIKTRSVSDDGKVHFYKHELASVDLCETILKRLKYSNDFISDVKFLVKNHMRTKQWGDFCQNMKGKSLRKLQYECGYKYFNLLLCLIDADNKAHATEFCLPNQCDIIAINTSTMCKNGTDMFDYKLPIDGDDVMIVKRLKPGKEIKECLDYALKLAFNNPLLAKESFIKLIKNYKLKKK